MTQSPLNPREKPSKKEHIYLFSKLKEAFIPWDISKKEIKIDFMNLLDKKGALFKREINEENKIVYEKIIMSEFVLEDNDLWKDVKKLHEWDSKGRASFCDLSDLKKILLSKREIISWDKYRKIPRKMLPHIVMPTNEITNPIPAFDDKNISFVYCSFVAFVRYASLISFGPQRKPHRFPRITGEVYILQMPKTFEIGDKNRENPLFIGVYAHIRDDNTIYGNIDGSNLFMQNFTAEIMSSLMFLAFVKNKIDRVVSIKTIIKFFNFVIIEVPSS